MPVVLTPIERSVAQWLNRVQQYVVWNPRSGRAVGSRKAENGNDGRAAHAAEAAELLVETGGTIQDGSSPACRSFWRLWAREVLADSDLLPSTEEIGALNRATSLPDLAGMIASRAIDLPKTSAEHYAAMFEAACIVLDALEKGVQGDRAVYTARATQIMNDLWAAARIRALTPHAERGLGSLRGAKRGGQERASARRQEGEEYLRAFADFCGTRAGLSLMATARLFLQNNDYQWWDGPDGERTRKIEALLRRRRRSRKKAGR